MNPANQALAPLFNVLVHNFSIGITYSIIEAQEWYHESRSPASVKRIVRMY
jgi:hypothetical protein